VASVGGGGDLLSVVAVQIFYYPARIYTIAGAPCILRILSGEYVAFSFMYADLDLENIWCAFL
jgi:hypothetical protein